MKGSKVYMFAKFHTFQHGCLKLLKLLLSAHHSAILSQLYMQLIRLACRFCVSYLFLEGYSACEFACSVSVKVCSPKIVHSWGMGWWFLEKGFLIVLTSSCIEQSIGNHFYYGGTTYVGFSFMDKVKSSIFCLRSASALNSMVLLTVKSGVGIIPLGVGGGELLEAALTTPEGISLT